MVKYSRDQSTEAPRRFIWSRMAPPYCSFHCQTRSMKGFAAQLLARRLSSAASWRSTIIWVAMPAWSVPGTQSVVIAAHAVPAGEDVHLRLVEHVAHVQAAGDVGRRQQHGEVALGGALVERGGVKEIFTHPVLGPVLFNGGGIVGFRKFVRHGSFRVTKRQTTTDHNRQKQRTDKRQKTADGREVPSAVVCFCLVVCRCLRTGSVCRCPSSSCSRWKTRSSGRF